MVSWCSPACLSQAAQPAGHRGTAPGRPPQHRAAVSRKGSTAVAGWSCTHVSAHMSIRTRGWQLGMTTHTRHSMCVRSGKVRTWCAHAAHRLDIPTPPPQASIESLLQHTLHHACQQHTHTQGEVPLLIHLGRTQAALRPAFRSTLRAAARRAAGQAAARLLRCPQVLQARGEAPGTGCSSQTALWAVHSAPSFTWRFSRR